MSDDRLVAPVRPPNGPGVGLPPGIPPPPVPPVDYGARFRRLFGCGCLGCGGLVFLFAPDARWMAGDPWLGHLAG